MKIAIVTLGCAKSAVDSSKMRTAIEAGGGLMVDDAGDADVIVVNTCGFIEPAKRESIDTLLEAASLGKRIIATGCLVERYGEELAEELTEVDLFVDLAGERNIWSLISEGAEGLSRGEEAERFAPSPRAPGGSPSEYLMIADGCSSRCSYCAIPSIRGPYRSRSLEEIVEEAAGFAESGVKELNIIAQDTSTYGIDLYGERKLPELLYRLSEIEEVEWLRLLYAQPQHITEELMEALVSTKACAYLDLPLQHASDRIIASMRRWGSAGQYLNLINSLRERVPGIAIRTSVIVGYPGECDEDFEKLVEFTRAADLDYLGIFEYSREEGTHAASLPNQVDEEIVNERNRELSVLRDDMMLRKASARVGTKADVLLETVEDGYIVGRASWQAPEVDGYVCLNGKAEIGSISTVTITSTDGCDYEAEPSIRPG